MSFNYRVPPLSAVNSRFIVKMKMLTKHSIGFLCSIEMIFSCLGNPLCQFKACRNKACAKKILRTAKETQQLGKHIFVKKLMIEMMNNDLISLRWHLTVIPTNCANFIEIYELITLILTNNPYFIMSKFITHKFNFHTLSLFRVFSIGLNTSSTYASHGTYYIRDMVLRNIGPLMDRSMM